MSNGLHEKPLLCRCCSESDELQSVTVEGWMAYLDDESACGCYYKAKLLWTWLWLMLGCSHCFACRSKGHKVVKKLFTGEHQLESKKFYFGVDSMSAPSVRSLHSTTQQTSRYPKTPGSGGADIVTPTAEDSVTRDADGCGGDREEEDGDGDGDVEEEEKGCDALSNVITPVPEHQMQVSTDAFDDVAGLSPYDSTRL